LGPLRIKVKSTANEFSDTDIYSMTATTRGYACILSYESFENRPDLVLEASQTDALNYANLFTQMGFTCDVHTSLTNEETVNALERVRDMKALNDVGCAVFVISSHGSTGDSFLTSDMKHIYTERILNLFKDTECPQLRNKPKLFIFDFCRGYYVENGSYFHLTSPIRIQESLQDMICLYSSSNGFSSYSFSKDGSAFGKALCHTFARHSQDMELHDLYRELITEYRKASPAVPQLRNIGFYKKFYFNPVSPTPMYSLTGTRVKCLIN
ncbi:hypothetical protein SK128_025170, partial [Halocaridina rubra]